MSLSAIELIKNVSTSTKVLQLDQLSDLTGTYYQKSETSSAVEISSALGGSAKISVDGELTQDFKFVHISYDDYAQLVIDEHTDPHTVYVLSGEGYDDQFGNRIANVGEPISTADAATKGYVDAQISSIPKPDMSEYYKKTETSSSTELADAFIAYPLKANVNLGYDSANKKIRLSADGHESEIDATDFIKDGMISSVTYDESTHTVHIVWNTDAGGKTTDISLSGLIDVYTAGYGLILDHGEFSVDTTEVAQISDISGFSKVSLISNDVEYSKDLSVIKLSADEYYTLVADGNVNQSALYVIDDDTNNAFGKKIVNVAPPELSDDAATKAYVDAQISSIPKPDLTEYYKKNETSSSSELCLKFNTLSTYDQTKNCLSNDGYSMRQDIDKKSASFITDESLSLDNVKSDLSVIKVTPEKYQWYINNYTQQELSSCVFVISSDVEDMFGKRVANVAEPSLNSDAATKKYVDDAISNIPTPPPAPVSKATDDYLQVLKPINDNRLFFSISFYDSFEMDNRLFTIDSYDATQLQYFRCLHNTGDGMAWEVPDAQGLGTDYDSMPMCVFVKKFAEDEEIDVSQITCAKYFWYYDDEQGVTHKSDEFSTIFPSTSDVNLPYVGYQETIAIGTEEDGTQHLFKMLLKVL